MKRSTKLIVALLVVVAALVVIYRLMHRVPSADLEANVQMQQIITDAGCLRCHTSTPELPFYANMPVAGKIVMEDVSKAYRAFSMITEYSLPGIASPITGSYNFVVITHYSSGFILFQCAIEPASGDSAII